MRRWYRIMNKGSELNRICPWIYSNHWYELFIKEMIEAQFSGDIKMLDTWAEEFRMNDPVEP